MPSIDYREDFNAADFVALANRVWPRAYEVARVEEAIARTINIGAWVRASKQPMRLVGRILLVLVVVLLVLVAWAWWYYRPTIEYTR